MHKWKFSLKFCEFVRINALKQFDRLIRRQCMLRDLRHELYHQWSLPSWGSRARCAPHVVFLLESMNCSQLGSSLGKLKMLPNGSGCRCHYIRHHLDWHWKGFHSSVFAGRAWREAPQLFSPVGKMLRQQNMQSSLILPGSPLIDLVILDSRTRLRRSLDANPRHGKGLKNLCLQKHPNGNCSSRAIQAYRFPQHAALAYQRSNASFGDAFFAPKDSWIEAWIERYWEQSSSPKDERIYVCHGVLMMVLVMGSSASSGLSVVVFMTVSERCWWLQRCAGFPSKLYQIVVDIGVDFHYGCTVLVFSILNMRWSSLKVAGFPAFPSGNGRLTLTAMILNNSTPQVRSHLSDKCLDHQAADDSTIPSAPRPACRTPRGVRKSGALPWLSDFEQIMIRRVALINEHRYGNCLPIYINNFSTKRGDFPYPGWLMVGPQASGPQPPPQKKKSCCWFPQSH